MAQSDFKYKNINKQIFKIHKIQNIQNTKDLKLLISEWVRRWSDSDELQEDEKALDKCVSMCVCVSGSNHRRRAEGERGSLHEPLLSAELWDAEVDGERRHPGGTVRARWRRRRYAASLRAGNEK